MCVKSCVGFTGPFVNLDRCPDCGEFRYKEKEFEDSDGELKIPRKVFTTFPVEPQLQARWKHPQTAKDMSYRWEKTQELQRERGELNEPLGIYDDILCGDAYLDAVDDGVINEYDTVLMLSIDGAQLYESKQSDCWIYIWIVIDLGPDKRYKIRNILPGGVIPGPDSPKDLDSFLFPGVSHVAALQREGLPIWDAYRRRRVVAFLFLLLVLADAVAMAQLSGAVGHHGRKGCRLFCGFAGRNKVMAPIIIRHSYDPTALKTIGRPLTPMLRSTSSPSQTPRNTGGTSTMSFPPEVRPNSRGVGSTQGSANLVYLMVFLMPSASRLVSQATLCTSR